MLKTKKKIYLTFDDGPIPEVTEFVLEQLKIYKAKATFFCVGENILKHPKIFQKIISEEHSIGNHSNNHLKAWNTSTESYIKNITACEDNILNYVDYSNHNKIFRPPYGQISYSKRKALKKLGYEIILWDVLSKDWKQDIPPEECVNHVIRNSKEGSIVVFHDNIKALKNLTHSLPKILEYFTNNGFTFEKIHH